jgi:very-short-patch-repair endonuclease
VARIKGQKPLTPAERQEIAQRYEAGETLEALMAAYQRGKPKIKEVVRAAGVTIRPRGYGKDREWTPEWRAAHKASCSTDEFAQKSRDGLLKRLPAMRGPALNTPIELRMQDALKIAGIGFTTQAPLLGRYLVDILLHQASIVIEADGAQHQLRRQKAKDAIRDAALTKAGYRMFRFTGKEINTDVVACVRRVIDECGLVPDEEPVYNISLARPSGPSHPRWKGGKREFTCQKCGAKFLAQPTHRRGKRIFCSRQCSFEATRGVKLGPRGPVRRAKVGSGRFKYDQATLF